MKNYIALDLETTGLSAVNNEIIEIGAWKIEDGAVKAKFNTLVKPVIYIPREIQRITGISNEMVSDCCSIEEILPEFYDFCEDLPLLGHNLPFDYGFLKEKFRRIGTDFSLSGARCGIDVLTMCRKCIYGTANFKLETIADWFNIHIESSRENFHRAAYDAYMTKLIYDRLLVLYPNISGVQMPKILDIRDKKVYGEVKVHDTLSFD